MGKTVLPSKRMEWVGLDRIQIVVHNEMGFIWREMSKDDYGLDGEIEVVVPKPDGKGFETTGGIIKVQSKAGKSYVVENAAASFSSPVTEEDLITWQRSNFPVLYIVYHPEDDQLYFVEVKEYLKKTKDAFAKPLRIKFDKRTDLFGQPSKAALANYASVSPPRISFTERERLFSNLLPVTELPQVVFAASTRRKDWGKLVKSMSGDIPPSHICGGQMLCCEPLENDTNPLHEFCKGKFTTLRTADLLESSDGRDSFLFMMRQLLSKHIYRCGARYQKNLRRYYFYPSNPADTVFYREWTSARTGSRDRRAVVKHYVYGKVSFWRHLAAAISFQQYGSGFYLEISPKYFFTVDGKHPCPDEISGPYTTKQKARERNLTVLNHVLFWADILSEEQPEIRLKSSNNVIIKIAKTPLCFVANFAIPDDPATYEEKVQQAQLSLFQPRDEDG